MSDRTFDDDRDPIGDSTRASDSPRTDEPSVERATENVLDNWPTPTLDVSPIDESEESVEDSTPATSQWSSVRDTPDSAVVAPVTPSVPEPEVAEPEPETGGWEDAPSTSDPLESEDGRDGSAESVIGSSEHAPGELMIPSGVPVLEGEPRGERRAVGIVVSRFNGDVTSKILESALAELERCGVDRASITVMPVPGAFELPIAAMALAKTRRFACILALGCVIRGDTPHFDYVCSEAASGLQLAAIETGVPVAFGVLTLDRSDQAEARYDKGAEAVRTGLEMADVFANLRAAAAR